MERRAKIVEIIQKVSRKKVTPDPDESLFDSGVIDSFNLPVMVSEIEKSFSVTVAGGDLNPRKFETIERIESYLDGHR
jgi:acyl carrier protein